MQSFFWCSLEVMALTLILLSKFIFLFFVCFIVISFLLISIFFCFVCFFVPRHITTHYNTKKNNNNWHIEESFQLYKISTTRVHTAQKMKFFIKDFFSKCDHFRSFLNVKLHILCSDMRTETVGACGQENTHVYEPNSFFWK